MTDARDSVFLSYYTDEPSAPAPTPTTTPSRVQAKLASRKRSNTITKPQQEVKLEVPPVSPLFKKSSDSYFQLSSTDPGRRANGLASPSPVPPRTPSPPNSTRKVKGSPVPSPNLTPVPGPRAPLVTAPPRGQSLAAPLRVETASVTPGAAGRIYSYDVDANATSNLPPPRAALVMPPSSPIVSSPSSLDGSPILDKAGIPFVVGVGTPGSGSINGEKDSLAGPDNDRMAPAGGEKVDFWRRFSMVAAEHERIPDVKSKRSRWLSKETRGSRGFKISIYVLAFVILAGLGGGLGYHFGRDKEEGVTVRNNPGVIGTGERPSLGGVGGTASGNGGGRPSVDLGAPAAGAPVRLMRKRHLSRRRLDDDATR